jgi:Ca-activated chloride channel family protein
MISDFHFIRPLWLLAIIPAIALVILLIRQRHHSASWKKAIAPDLLDHLLEAGPEQQTRWPWYSLLVIWSLLSIAMAGPTWNKLPQPVHQQQDALVIVLDLSLSMFAEDVSPSRLQRAQHKIHDILKIRQEGLTALVAYSGDAHIVSPLTDDSDTIANMVPALSPEMMPVYGSNPVAAFELAQDLLQQAGIVQGRLLLLTDDITEKNIHQLNSALRTGISLSLLAIGTEEGAPIKARKGFLKDDAGNIIVPKLHRQRLLTLANQTGARYSDLQLDDRDIQYLLDSSALTMSEHSIKTDRQFDQWQDHGPWLVLLALPFALLTFRRGWLLILPLFILLQPHQSQALEWQDLWQRPDQRAAEALQQGNTKQAAEQFKNSQWRATAHYQAGDFDQAAQGFNETLDADSHYNRGNALARAGKLPEAIEAYKQALQLSPDMEDASFNQQLLKDLLEQQKQQEQSSDEDSSQQDQKQKQQDQNSQQPSSQQSDENQHAGEKQPSSSDPQEQNSKQQNQNQEQSTQQKEPQQEQQQAEQTTDDEKKAPESNNKQAMNQEQTQEEKQEQQRQQQATEQWLRQIPDDPAGLLRNKFRHQHQLRQQQRHTPDEEQPQW